MKSRPSIMSEKNVGFRLNVSFIFVGCRLPSQLSSGHRGDGGRVVDRRNLEFNVARFRSRRSSGQISPGTKENLQHN
jgi:hypothetical protein